MKILWWSVLGLAVLGLGFLGWRILGNKQESQPVSEKTKSAPTWQEEGVAIAGKFADAEIVDLGGGKYRLYYSVEPEVSGNKLEMYSSTSTDGITWTKEEGIRKEFATFPDVVKLPDGRFRMYFQNAGVIKSATSPDGLNWMDDPGVRIDKPESALGGPRVGPYVSVAGDAEVSARRAFAAINEPYQT